MAPNSRPPRTSCSASKTLVCHRPHRFASPGPGRTFRESPHARLRHACLDHHTHDDSSISTGPLCIAFSPHVPERRCCNAYHCYGSWALVTSPLLHSQWQNNRWNTQRHSRSSWFRRVSRTSQKKRSSNPKSSLLAGWEQSWQALNCEPGKSRLNTSKA